MSHRVEMLTADQIAELDPFAGGGVFLPFLGTAEEIMTAVETSFWPLQMVAWPERGAWVDLRGSGIDPVEFRSHWDDEQRYDGP